MSLRASLLTVLALAVPVVAGACSVTTAPTPDNYTLKNQAGSDGGDAGEAAVMASDGGLGEPQVAAPTLRGSPLCNAPLAGGGCYPDQATTAKACGLAPDGGAYNSAAGYDNAPLACRVVGAAPDATGNDQAPTCTPAGNAGDGSWCKSSGECQAAFDCVGAGTCQHYCCSGNSACTSDQFCDIQPVTEATGVEVPVCMPLHMKGCTLLDPTSCPATETCAVVRDDGTTSCVAIGGAKAGADCDKDHCAAGLVCLGAPGSRQCFQLCDTSTARECSTAQRCKGGLPLFPDPSVGICQ